MVSWLVGAVLAAWLLVTVLRNLPFLRTAFGRHDAAKLIPDWALFARPRTADVVLLRRDLLRDGTLTSWREVEVAGPRRWYNFIWNPELGPRRAFLTLGTILAHARNAKRPAGDARGQGTPVALTVMPGVPYLNILRYLSERSHPAVEATQFMIMAVEGQAITGRHAPSGATGIDFVSEFHRVRGGEPG
jgi:hypothetical protein